MVRVPPETLTALLAFLVLAWTSGGESELQDQLAILTPVALSACQAVFSHLHRLTPFFRVKTSSGYRKGSRILRAWATPSGFRLEG